jgi:hypothetical protein
MIPVNLNGCDKPPKKKEEGGAEKAEIRLIFLNDSTPNTIAHRLLSRITESNLQLTIGLSGDIVRNHHRGLVNLVLKW